MVVRQVREEPRVEPTPAILPCAVLWEDTSITKWLAPADRAAAITSWSSWGKGVVSPVRSTFPAAGS